MKYFDYLTKSQLQDIFHIEPSSFDGDSIKEILACSLGATLYMPAVRESMVDDIISRKHKGLISVVICLEDAIGDSQVDSAEQFLVDNLNRLSELAEKDEFLKKQLPLIFLRVRSPEQMSGIAYRAGRALSVLTGFVFPKFCLKNGRDYFYELNRINSFAGRTLYAMPILESEDVAYIEKKA